jgi:peroxiredoxin
VRNKKFHVAILFILLNIPLFFAHATEESTSSPLFQTPAIIIDAPDLSLPNLQEKVENISDYRGKVVLLHFWATWCASCLKELPELQILWEKLQSKDLVVIAVAEDSWQSVQAFVKTNNFTFPIWIDQYGRGLREYSIKGFPSTYLISREGKLQGLAVGFRQWTKSTVFNEVESLLILDK